MSTNSVETASNLPMFILILWFLSSGFVPTNSMPGSTAWFAENQPFTPVIEAVRALLLGRLSATTACWRLAGASG